MQSQQTAWGGPTHLHLTVGSDESEVLVCNARGLEGHVHDLVHVTVREDAGGGEVQRISTAEGEVGADPGPIRHCGGHVLVALLQREEAVGDQQVVHIRHFLRGAHGSLAVWKTRG